MSFSDPAISIPCDNGNHAECKGWVAAPFNGAAAYACPCGGCNHPNAWTQEQATDWLLAGRWRAYPGEQVWRGGRPHILGRWPGCTPRPVHMIVVVSVPGSDEGFHLTVTLTEPSEDYETNKGLAADVAERNGHTLVPSMGGTRFCAWERKA